MITRDAGRRFILGHGKAGRTDDDFFGFRFPMSGARTEAASCARQIKGAAKRKAAAMSHERFCIQVTSNFSRGRLARLPPDASTALILLFREEVFSGRPHTRRTRMRWNGQIFWLLACGSETLRGTPSSRLHPRTLAGDWLMGSRIQLQQRNCSRISREFLAPVHLNQNSTKNCRQK